MDRDDPNDLLERLAIGADERHAAAPGGAAWLAAAALGLALGIGGTYYVLERQSLPAETTVVPATTVPAPPAPPRSEAILEAAGYVTARRQATVSSQITGRLDAVYIEEGDHVEKGQLLARLDDRLARARLALVKAELDAARSRLEELTLEREEARLELARIQTLHARDLTSRAALDQSRLAVDVLDARIITERRAIDVAEGRVAVERQQLALTEIRAPFAAVVVAKAAQPGEVISPISAGGGFTRTGVGTLVDMDSLEMEVDVSESNITRVFPGQAVTATLDAFPRLALPGTVITVVPTADRNKATIKVRIGFDESDARILPDMGVQVAFLEGSEP